jgi:hypothetical protein
LWISVADDAPAGLKVLLNGTTIPTTQSSGIMTTRIAGDNFDRLFTRRGKVEVALFNPHQGTKQVIGQFMVNDPGAFATTQSGKPSTVFHQVSDWGPKATPVSTPFNPQQDNRSAFWIKSACAPPRTMARLGDVELQVMVSAEIITAKLGGIDALKVKGPLPLTLFDPVTQDSVLVGEFLVGE